MPDQQELLQRVLGVPQTRAMLPPEAILPFDEANARPPLRPWQVQAGKVFDSAIDGFLGMLGVAPTGETKANLVGQLLSAGAPLAAGVNALKRVAKPIKAYHGTPDRTLKIPDPRKAVEVGGASWFSTNKDVAEQYQWPREYGEIMDGPRGRVIEANLNISNPMEVDFNGDVGEAIRLGKLVREAKEKGHDALVVKNVDDTVDSSRQIGTSIAVWDPSLIEFVKKYGIAAAVASGYLTQAALQQAMSGQGQQQ